MFDARAVANFFLDRADAGGRSITSMLLLKVLYFAHAWYLAKYDAPLVAQPFEAWQYGPVNRVVYDQIKVFGSNPIIGRLESLDVNNCIYAPTRYEFTRDVELFLENIFDYYSKFHPYKLSDLTHEAGSPWDVVWKTAETKAVPGMVIPNALILEWFRSSGNNRAGQRERGHLA